MPDGIKVYFDTMLYLNKFQDPATVRRETQNMFNKVKTGEYHLVVSQLVLMEIYHVLCRPFDDITKFAEAESTKDEINRVYDKIKTALLSFPHTEFAENEFNGIDSMNLTNFVENVPGSKLIDFLDMRKLPGSMDFMHLMVASNLKCEKFITEDKGVILLDSYNQKGNMKIIRPYR